MHARHYTLTEVTKPQQVFSYLIGGRFLFRKINMSQFSGSKLLLFSLIISPTVENILSAGTKVAGMQRKHFATWAIVGKCSAFFCHHCRQFSSEERDCILKKSSVSFYPSILSLALFSSKKDSAVSLVFLLFSGIVSEAERLSHSITS